MTSSATPGRTSAATEEVRFASGTETLSAFLAIPEGTGPFPGLVVIHEIYGLNQNIQEIAQRLAAEGYLALAVDLFSERNRTACMFRFMAGIFTNSLDHQGICDLQRALDFLEARPDVAQGQLGAIGFCMGGSFAVALGCKDRRLAAIAPFYGMNPRPAAALARLCPVVGSYPGLDFTAKAGRQLDASLDQYGIAHDIRIYEGAKHSFFNDHGPAYQVEASQDAWKRVLDFFADHVKGQANR